MKETRLERVGGGGEGRPVEHHVPFPFLLLASPFPFVPPFKRASSLEPCATRTLGSEDFFIVVVMGFLSF